MHLVLTRYKSKPVRTPPSAYKMILDSGGMMGWYYSSWEVACRECTWCSPATKVNQSERHLVHIKKAPIQCTFLLKYLPFDCGLCLNSRACLCCSVSVVIARMWTGVYTYIFLCSCLDAYKIVAARRHA